MDSPNETLVKVLDSLDKRQKSTSTLVTKTTNDLYRQVTELMMRCSALESIQHRLFTALAEINAPIHSKILDEIKSALSEAESKGISSGPPADHFRSLLDEKPVKKVHLKLVPKRPSPASPSNETPDG